MVEANWNEKDLKGLGKELVTKYNIYSKMQNSKEGKEDYASLMRR